MKFVILGLGNFGASLATKLTERGHEVIGVDMTMNRVEMLKDQITHTVCINVTDPQAVKNLPLAESDVVIIALGEDAGANIMATALLKQLRARRIICRAVSPLHITILEAMGMDEIVHPEEESAERLATSLTMQGVINSFVLSEAHNIVEARVPVRCHGKSIEEIGFRRNYNVVILAIKKTRTEKNVLGATRKVSEVEEVASTSTIVNEGDILVLYGHVDDIKKFLKA